MKAVYAAMFQLENQKRIQVGALGKIEFQPGLYIYIGSAMTNVEKRLERHFSEVENHHWHIDYFSCEVKPLDCFILPESSDYECKLAEAASRIGEPVHKFGSSDCHCGSHLFHVPV